MQSSATTRSQATSSFHTIQPNIKVVCMVALERGYTHNLDRIQSLYNVYYPVGHCQSSVGPYQWRGLGIMTRIACSQNTGMVCRYITRKRLGVTQVFQQHWHTGPYTKRDKPGYSAQSVDRDMQAVGIQQWSSTWLCNSHQLLFNNVKPISSCSVSHPIVSLPPSCTICMHGTKISMQLPKQCSLGIYI